MPLITTNRLHKKSRAAWLPGALAAFGLAAAVWTLALALFGFYPFGEASILITDLNQQYVEFHAALYDMVRSGDSLLYTWNTGMGMNFLGLFAYYLSSPFTLLMWLFPRALLTEALLFIISMKIAACAFTFSVCLRRLHGVGGAANLVGALLYALGGYSVTYCFNLMWLDGVVLLPLVVMAARHVFDTKKIAPLTAVLAVLFLSNFYIAYVVGIFAFLLFISWIAAAESGHRQAPRRMGAFLGAAALAAGLTAFLLLPTAFSLFSGYEEVHGLSLTFYRGANPLALPGKLGWAAFDSATNSGEPALYSGVLAIALVPLWFTHRDISRREKCAVGGVLLFLLASLLLHDLDLAWHVFQPPNWFPYRYTFVIIFLLTACAARVLARPEGVRLRTALVSFGAAVVVTLLAGASGEIPYAGNWWATALMLGGYAALFLALRASRIERPPLGDRPVWRARAAVLLAAVLTACTAAETLFNSTAVLHGLDDQFGFVERENFTNYVERNGQLLSLLEAQRDDGFYRVENSTARNANDGLDAGYRAVSHYSSLSNQAAFKFMGRMGMISYVSNRFFRYMGSTSALDAVMGVKYVWDTEERRPYMTSTGSSYGDTTLYRNEMALPLAYFTDALFTRTDGDEDPFALQNRLFSSMDGRDTAYYTPLSLHIDCTGGSPEENGAYTTVPAGSELTITIDNPRRQHVLFYMENSLSEHSPVFLGDKKLNVYDDRLIRGVIDLGEQEAGQVEVRVPVWYTGWYARPVAYSFDEAAFSSLVERLRQSAPSRLQVTDTAVEGTLAAPRDGYLFTSIPYDAGWTAVIDGQAVKPVKTGNAFIALPLTAGEHTFALRFFPKGMTAGLLISGVSLAVCAALLLRRKKAAASAS